MSARAVLQHGILQRLHEQGGKFEGTFTTFAQGLKNAQNGAFPFEDIHRTLRQIAVLEDEKCLKAERGQTAEPMHRGFVGHVVTAITLLEKGKKRAEAPAPVLREADPPAATSVGAPAVDKTPSSPSPAPTAAPPKDSEITERRITAISACLRSHGGSCTLKELHDKFGGDKNLFPSGWAFYNFMKRLEERGIVKSEAIKGRKDVRQGKQVTLVESTRSAPAASPVQSSSPAAQPTTPPAAGGARRLLTKEELGVELERLRAEIRERTAALGALQEREDRLARLFGEYDTLVGNVADLLVADGQGK
ncbi:hypothetical protein HY478_00845 [Candidatus Uhrbacteria bacterium]|nr:hypothetical protein [Candidatus Uhrbacteria bacterium]